MPSLEEVIAHYEKELQDEGVIEEDGEGESEPEPEDIGTVATAADTMDVIMEGDDEEEDKHFIDNSEHAVNESDESDESSTMVSKIVDLGHPEEETADMSKFSSIKAKELKEVCRSLGFSPKGTKPELVLRLLKHPSFSNEDDIVQSIVSQRKGVSTETEEKTDDEPVSAEDGDSMEVIIS